MTTTPRELLDLADRHRRLASDAEMFRVRVRLGNRPTLLRRLLSIGEKHPTVIDAGETSALYEALAIVRDDHQRMAAEYEARVTTTESEDS